MRARYYNPDIKRFINQDIKVGGIDNGQGMNRYAYCEGNPINMVDPFGLCGENANDQGGKHKGLHMALDVIGMFWDGADLINAAVYALDGEWVEAGKSLLCASPFLGTGIAVGFKATKYAKAAKVIGETIKVAGKIATTVSSVENTFINVLI